MLPNFCEELSENRACYCGNVVLGTSPDSTVNRIANEIYSRARSGKLSVNGFPDYSPAVNALTAAAAARNNSATYKVSVNKGGKLLLLEAFAAKWTELEQTKERALALIDAHNKQYNTDGEYWMRTVFGNSALFTLLKRLH